MDYNEQIKVIVEYIKQGEKKEQDFKIGIEIEHFILDKDTLQSISY